MSVNIVPVVNVYNSALYDGTNGADVAAAVPGADFVSDNGTELRFDIDWSMGTNNYTMLDGQTVVWRVNFGDTEIYGIFDQSEFDAKYAPLP